MKKGIILLTMMIALLALNSFIQSVRKFYKAGNEFVKNPKYEDATRPHAGEWFLPDAREVRLKGTLGKA